MGYIFDTLEKLVSVALPSGQEHKQAELIASLARPYCDEIYYDRAGNLVCRKKSFGKKLMIPAHMDVIGFMATYADERGFIRFAPVGGHTAYSLINQRVRFQNGVYGYIRSDKTDEKKLSDITKESLYIDIGASSRENALSMISIGDCAVFDAKPSKNGDFIITPYADNLASCAVLLLAMSKTGTSVNDLYFVFTVQEELGLRGAKTAANAIMPDMGIAIDLTRTGDAPSELDKNKMSVRLGAGPAIKIRDSSLICDRPVVDFLRSCAENNGIAYQDEVLPAGGTDSAAMQRSRHGVLSGCVSIPGRNIHSPSEIINEKDAEGAASLIACAAMTEI